MTHRCHRGCDRVVPVEGALCGPANDCAKGAGHPGWTGGRPASDVDLDPDDPILTTTAALREELGEITFAPSCLDMGWDWVIREVEVRDVGAPAGDAPMLGWLISTSFQRPDRATGTITRGRGREMWVPSGATLSAAVKTAWVAAKLIVDHELFESFKYKGRRVFDPHATVAELTGIGRDSAKKAP